MSPLPNDDTLEVNRTLPGQSREQTDARDLARLGYKQEFQRDFGGFSNFALSFSVISILTGAVTLYDYGLSMGGPRQMTLGWPLATLGTLLIVLSMAELCSAFPTSGGMIHWSAKLGGRTWAWFTRVAEYCRPSDGDRRHRLWLRPVPAAYAGIAVHGFAFANDLRIATLLADGTEPLFGSLGSVAERR